MRKLKNLIMLNDKARQNILSAFIVILLIFSVFSSIFSFPIGYVDAEATSEPIVQTDVATGIMETNATLHGTLVDDGGGNCTVWFEYGTTLSYGNDTRYNLSYNFMNSTTSTDTLKNTDLQFHSDYWIQNTTIGANTSITTFLNTTGLGDNISYIFRLYNGAWTSWTKGLDPVYMTLHDITSDGIYYFYLTNDTVPFILDWDVNISRTTGYSMEQHLYTRPGQLYHYRAGVNNSINTTYGSDEVFLSRPKSIIQFPGGAYPYVYVNGTYSPTVLNLTWIKGMGANNTYIERNTASSWSHGDGTTVYNDTGTYYNDTDLTVGTLYYYQVWGFANWTYNGITYHQYSSDYASNSNTTNTVFPPYDGSSTYDVESLKVNLTWNRGNNSDREIVVQNNNTYPTSPIDGWIRQNDTATFFNESIIYSAYFTIWSYNDTSRYYSITGLNIPWGALVINCYDEETNDSLYFDVFISNQDGSQTYESLDNTNPHYLDINQLPTGDDIKITVSAASNYSEKSDVSYWSVDENYTITYIVLSQTADSKSSTNVTCINESNGAHSYPAFTLDADLVTILPDNADVFTKIFVNYTHEEYSSRLYYRDIGEVGFDTLNAYLPPTEDKQLYLLEVIDEAGNTVDDAYIDIKRSVDGIFVIISRLLTDANGQADINLISDRNYIFIISKDGYVTENASWIPGTSIFTHTFKILWETIPFEPDTFGDIINFYGTLYENNTMRVSFYDLDDGMTDSHFTVYEDYNGTLTYMGEYNGTTSNDIVFWIDVSNATRLHTIVLYMNHSTLGEVINYRIVVYPVHVDRESGTWLENLIVGVVGDFTYGYVISFLWYLPCVLLVAGLAAIRQPGIGILAAGLYSIWITWYIEVPGEAKILAFASIALVTGFITLFLVKGKEVVH